jgi:hypothetical protein
MKQMKRIPQIRFSLGILAATLMVCSCQTGKEVHYFKEGDNYYRLRIKEKALFSSSRYISGFFEEAAVDRFFGEIKRPDSTFRVNPKLEKITSSDGTSSLEGKKLVLILSTNANAISDQIGALAKNEEALEMIARLANQDVIDRNAQLNAQRARHDLYVADVTATMDSYLGTMVPATLAANPSDGRAHIESMLDNLVVMMGGSPTNGDFQRALNMLQNRPMP